MKKRNWNILAMVLLVLMTMSVVLTSCQEPQNNMPNSVDSISVRVVDSTGAKTITPEGNVDISHYVVTIVNEAEGISQSSGYLTKGSMFAVSNVPAGIWYATVDAFVQNDGATGGYAYVATAKSEPTQVGTNENATLVVTLDKILDSLSGDVDVTLMLPSAFQSGSKVYVMWELRKDGKYISNGWSSALELDVKDGGTSTFTLTAEDVIGDGGGSTLSQGVWTLAVTARDDADSPAIERKGVEVLRLIAGLPASGVVNLSSENADEEVGVEITDQIGDNLVLGQTGVAIMEDMTTIILGYNGIPTDSEEMVSVDGERIGTTESDGVYYETEAIESGKVFTIHNMAKGEHLVTIAVSDGTMLGAGSITLKVDAESSIFTFSLNTDCQSYTVTGLKKSEGEFIQEDPDIFEIPPTHNGLPVTIIGERAFVEREDLTGSLVLPDSIKEIKANAFYGCMNMTGTLDLGASVESIEYRAFQDCAFSGDLVLPESMRYVGEKAFRQFYDRGMFSGGQLVLNEGLEEIGPGAFDGVKFTGTLVIPSTVTKIGDLSKEKLENGSGSTYSGAFQETGFTELVFVENSQLESIGDNTFHWTDLTGRVEMPATIRAIGHGCFRDTGPYEYFSLASASNLEYIGENAFWYVDFGAGSPTIEWPDNMTTVEHGAFYRARNISVNLHDNITEIEGDAFSGFSGDVTTEGEARLPSELIRIGMFNSVLFPGRDEVPYFKLPENLEVIGSNNYIGANNVYIPASVATVGDAGFGRNGGGPGYQTLYFAMDESVSESWPDDGYYNVWWNWMGAYNNGTVPYTRQTMFWNVPEEEFDAIMNNDSVPYDVPEPVISVDGGNATITCEKAFAHIYYTTDGSEPTKRNGTLYKEPFAVESGVAIKAVAYVGNDIYSIVTESSGV